MQKVSHGKCHQELRTNEGQVSATWHPVGSIYMTPPDSPGEAGVSWGLFLHKFHSLGNPLHPHWHTCEPKESRPVCLHNEHHPLNVFPSFVLQPTKLEQQKVGIGYSNLRGLKRLVRALSWKKRAGGLRLDPSPPVPLGDRKGWGKDKWQKQQSLKLPLGCVSVTEHNHCIKDLSQTLCQKTWNNREARTK